MNKSYADVLESYLIAEEGLFSKIKSGINKLEKWDRKKNPQKYAAIDKRKADKEKARKATDSTKDNSNNYYKFNINAEKALDDSKLNLTPYPEGKWEDQDDLFNAIERDLKLALPKILSCKEVIENVNKFCEEYNKTPKDELEDRFFMEDFPSKMSLSWFKSQFCVDSEGDYFMICEGDQCFRSSYGIEIVDIMAKYIKKKYSNYNLHVGTGDGDEGCVYPFD